MDAVWRRLRKLKDTGYIKQHTIAHGMVVYTGTKESRDITEANVTLPESLTLYTARHTLLMTDLILYHQLQARKHGREFQYKTEREFRYEILKETDDNRPVLTKINENKERFPDCVFIVKTNGQTLKIWVELELSKKENKRYEEKFKKRFDPMLKNGEYDQIWYFSDQLKIRNAVEKARAYLGIPEKLKVEDIPSVIKTDNWEVFYPD